MHTETGWLVEMTLKSGQVWWTARGGCREWTTDAFQAVRFARKEDAEQVARYQGLILGVNGRAAEHAFDLAEWDVKSADA